MGKWVLSRSAGMLWRCLGCGCVGLVLWCVATSATGLERFGEGYWGCSDKMLSFSGAVVLSEVVLISCVAWPPRLRYGAIMLRCYRAGVSYCVPTSAPFRCYRAAA